MINLIAAHDRNFCIGNQNKLLCHLPADLKYFKQQTLNKPVLMGRKTFESIGKPLPSRTNIILTKDKRFAVSGCHIVHSVEEALKELSYYNKSFVIGGSQIYSQFLPYADKLHLTYIDHEFEGDAYFPSFNQDLFKLTSETKGVKDEKNPYDYYFRIYEKLK